MLGKRSVWECNGKTVLVILLLVSSTSSFCMDSLYGYFFSGRQSESTTSDNDEIFRLLHEELGKIDSEDDKYKLPEWQVKSCIQNMPEQLRITYNYLKSGDIDDPTKCIPSKHRMLLVGPPGSSKSCTAEAIAQKLGYPKKVIGATALRGKHRGHTAIKIRDLFNSLKSTKSHMVLIINEIHKLFANYREGRTDDAENVTAFLEGVDYFERHCHNIVTIGTTNWANKVPPEMKSRFRGRVIFVPLPTEDQLRNTIEEIFNDDDSITRSESVDHEFIANLCPELKDYSYRDVQYFIDDAKGATYLDGPTFDEKGRKILDVKHFQAALDGVKASDDAVGYEEVEEMTEAERHQESIDLQEQHFVQQRKAQVVSEKAKKTDEITRRLGSGNIDFLCKMTSSIEENMESVFYQSLSARQKKIYDRFEEERCKEIEKRKAKEKEEEIKKKAEEEEQKRAAAQTQSQSKKKDSSCSIA